MSKPAFRYSHYDLKGQTAGSVVEITLSAINNVRLMTARNFDLFTQVQPYKYIGGVAKSSPVRLTIPESGHWHVIVDMEGLPGLAESSLKVIPQAPRSKAS